MEVFPPWRFWWLHQSPLSEERPPCGRQQMSEMFNSSPFFWRCRRSVEKKQKKQTDSDCKNSDNSFRRYLWVEADVWDGGRLVVRLVPEGGGLVEVTPQLWETSGDNYCWYPESVYNNQTSSLYIIKPLISQDVCVRGSLSCRFLTSSRKNQKHQTWK